MPTEVICRTAGHAWTADVVDARARVAGVCTIAALAAFFAACSKMGFQREISVGGAHRANPPPPLPPCAMAFAICLSPCRARLRLVGRSIARDRARAREERPYRRSSPPTPSYPPEPWSWRGCVVWSYSAYYSHQLYLPDLRVLGVCLMHGSGFGLLSLVVLDFF